jgi:hypothetical protein
MSLPAGTPEEPLDWEKGAYAGIKEQCGEVAGFIAVTF